MNSDFCGWENNEKCELRLNECNYQQSLNEEDSSNGNIWIFSSQKQCCKSSRCLGLMQRNKPHQPISVKCDSDKLKVKNISLLLNTHDALSISSISSNNTEAHSYLLRCTKPNFKSEFLLSSRTPTTINPTNVPKRDNLKSHSEPLPTTRNMFQRTYPSNVLISSMKLCVVVFFCSYSVGLVSSSSNLVAQATNTSIFESSLNNNIDEGHKHYTHTWALHIPDGNADEVARDTGFTNLGMMFPEYYIFRHNRVSKRSLKPAEKHHIRLSNDHRVKWTKQQRAKSRSKRDFIRMRPSRTSIMSKTLLMDTVPLNDPKWPQMWYLNRGGGLDMNVIPAWKEGITGKGVVVTILDDGLESDHPDIAYNYDKRASYDVNNHDDDPMPQYDMADTNRHGTRCAGEVAASANNSICAVGIAYDASVGGVRMLDGDVTDAVEARSLSLNPQHIDIYSASWGPDDDGKTVDGPGELATRAFIEGITKGRNGKGSIFIWASGNGGRDFDNCNCDGYTNSIWTLSISSATENGQVPWYSEKCSSTLATTYSSGANGQRQVVTTDLHHSCTTSHTGTSASAPLAAGIAALALESNPNLTWRDLQHIVVRTAKPANLKDPTWSKNGVGRRVSHSFGYGLMDAASMVKLARTWKTVPEQQKCEINAPHVDKMIAPKGSITLQLTVKHCLSVNYLEHVQAKITLTSQRRGDIQLYLKSPAGTKVTLLTSRFHDVSRMGFTQWPFMSVHTWGESPHGNWQLEIHNEGRYMAQITQWELIFYGTATPAQPEDPVQINAGQFEPIDVEHNLLEYDTDSSGQWENMKQVGESNPEAQHISNDQTNIACRKLTLDQRCLECAAPTYIYDSKCYIQCPDGAYMDSNQSIINYQSLPPTARDMKTKLLEYRNNNIFNSGYFQEQNRSAKHSNGIIHERKCIRCAKNCLQCFGPDDFHCNLCYPGYRKALNANETYCYPFSEELNSENISLFDTWHNNALLLTAIIISSSILIGIVIFLACTGKLLCTGKKENKQNYVYDRVALVNTAADDEPIHLPDHNVIVESESDSGGSYW